MIKQYIIGLLCVLLFSCATLPIDTLNKKLAAFEITYGQVLESVGAWINDGTLSGENKKKVQVLIQQISEARAAVYMAKGINDLRKAESQLSAAQRSILLLRQLLEARDKQAILNPRGGYNVEYSYSVNVT